MKKGIMDEGWNDKVRKAVREGHKAVEGIKPEKKADPKKKLAAIEAEIARIEAAYKAENKK